MTPPDVEHLAQLEADRAALLRGLRWALTFTLLLASAGALVVLGIHALDFPL